MSNDGESKERESPGVHIKVSCHLCSPVLTIKYIYAKFMTWGLKEKDYLKHCELLTAPEMSLES